jgi:hypothetical protein
MKKIKIVKRALFVFKCVKFDRSDQKDPTTTVITPTTPTYLQ